MIIWLFMMVGQIHHQWLENFVGILFHPQSTYLASPLLQTRCLYIFRQMVMMLATVDLILNIVQVHIVKSNFIIFDRELWLKVLIVYIYVVKVCSAILLLGPWAWVELAVTIHMLYGLFLWVFTKFLYKSKLVNPDPHFVLIVHVIVIIPNIKL